MKFLRSVLLFSIALGPSFLQSKIIMEPPKEVKGPWESMAEKLFDVKAKFEKLVEEGRDSSPKIKEKIKKIEDKRSKKLRELKEERDNQKIKFSKYLEKTRDAREDYDDDIEDLSSKETRGTKDKITHEFEKQIDHIAQNFFEGNKEAADEEFNEISILETAMETDIYGELGKWEDKRPSGDDVEKKLTWLEEKFSTAMAAKYPPEDPEKMQQIEKLQKEEAEKLAELEKKKNIFTILIYLIKKEKLESDYKKKYEEIGGEPFMIRVEWGEHMNKVWFAWHEKDKGDYKNALEKLDKMMKDIE